METSTTLLLMFINQIDETGNIPDDCFKSVFIPLTTKTISTQGSNFSLIIHMNHYVKSFTKEYLINARWTLDKTNWDSEEGLTQKSYV